MRWRERLNHGLVVVAIALLAACATVPEVPPVDNPPVAGPLTPIDIPDRPVIAFALGGGAARGFAHVGVLKVLEENGIQADIVVGTSAGGVAGAFYAGGVRGDALVEVAGQLGILDFADWTMPNRGFINGELLQQLVNEKLGNRPIETLDTVFVAVASDLRTGKAIAFTQGNTGMAVRASSSLPGVFHPVDIDGREYVDGGLVSQVPIRIARRLGADIVIAVDVSRLPEHNTQLESTLDILHQALLIMSQAVLDAEVGEADVLIRPEVGEISLVGFDQRPAAIAQGEQAARDLLPIVEALISKKAAEKRQASRKRGQ